MLANAVSLAEKNIEIKMRTRKLIRDKGSIIAKRIKICLNL